MEQVKERRVMMAFDTTHEVRHKIKEIALRRNITMSKWLMRAVEKQLLEETKNEKPE
jgi:hypothetical protein